MQRLGKEVCRLVCSWNEGGSNDPLVHSGPKPVEAQIEVFHAPMMLWMLRYLDG